MLDALGQAPAADLLLVQEFIWTLSSQILGATPVPVVLGQAALDVDCNTRVDTAVAATDEVNAERQRLSCD